MMTMWVPRCRTRLMKDLLGSFDDQALEYAKKEFKAAVGGNEGRGGEGWCVLVDGDNAIARAKGEKKGNL